MAGAGVDDSPGEYLEEEADAPVQDGVRPCEEEVGIGFEYVEVGVRSLLFVGILFTQAEVFEWGPVAAKGLEIALLFGVEGMCFDELIESDRLVEGGRVARGTIIFADAVEGEGLSV